MDHSQGQLGEQGRTFLSNVELSFAVTINVLERKARFVSEKQADSDDDFAPQ